MPTEMESSYLVTAPQNLVNIGVNISTRRSSLDGTLMVIDFYCLTVPQINAVFAEGFSIESFDDIRYSTVVIVGAMLIQPGYTLYTYDDICTLMQTPAWSQGEE
jgi:hypothetical protein